MFPSKTFPLVIIAALLAACQKEAPKTEDVRPVRAMALAADTLAVNAEFPGEVRARVESRLGFRVAGKIVARKVDVGTVVRKGQLLMALDPQDLRLAETAASASLRAAETNRDLALADYKRYQELAAKGFVSGAILDAKAAAYKAAVASADAARAQLHGQANQAAYASLVADVDGVVTAVNAEVGQVVAAGTPVVQVAASGEKEVVIGVPEDRVDALRNLKDVTVHLWAAPNERLAGKVREVSPIADPATRTYAMKISVPSAPASMKLGMTASVRFTAPNPVPLIHVPLTALYQDHGKTALWVVDKGTVALVPVQLNGNTGNDAVVVAGVRPGQTVVTAGVHQLQAGQKVKILGVDVPAPVANAQTPLDGAAK
ncbi:MAG: efflux RND transporter periplasmic adaptor subunit [Telluria sp.]